jgi:hypothetical protein
LGGEADGNKPVRALGCFPHVLQNAAGLYLQGQPARIDRADRIHAAERQHDLQTIACRNGTTGDTRIAALRDNADIVITAGTDYR